MNIVKINLNDRKDAVVDKSTDHNVIVYGNGGPESRIYGNRILIPRISKSKSMIKAIKEMKETGISVDGADSNFMLVNFIWPNGDWGLVIGTDWEIGVS